MSRWHILTGEYPPQPGGVSDYTRRVAVGLAQAGDRVEVWAPDGLPDAAADRVDEGGVVLHRLPDRFGRRSLALLDRALDAGEAPQRLLVQYVPQAFGWKGGNVPFCRWLARSRRDEVWVMFHEVAFPVGRAYTARQNALGVVNGYMARVVAAAAARVFVSTSAWRPDVERHVRPGTPVAWLPVPSAIPVVDDPVGAAALKARYANGSVLVGHFGTDSALLRPGLDGALAALAASTSARVLLIGRGSAAARARLADRCAALGDRLAATGELTPEQVSLHLAACDVMVQPYPDGVSTRRTSAMAALAHAKPLVTTEGALTESFWADSGAAILAPASDAGELGRRAAALIAERGRWSALGSAARALYVERFSLQHTIEALRS